MKLLILTLMLAIAVPANCGDHNKQTEALSTDKQTKSDDLIQFKTLVGVDSTHNSPRVIEETPKCKPSKKCLKANGKCGNKEMCKGRIIRNGCRRPKGCGNSICCAPRVCKPKRKCREQNGSCILKEMNCAGQIIKNGCGKGKNCKKTHVCCVPPSLTTTVVPTTEAPTIADNTTTQEPTTTDIPPIISDDEFIERFNKTYENEQEAKKRIAIFHDNVKDIENHNKQFEAGKSSYQMGVNEFSDLTYDEVVRYLTGEKESNISERYSLYYYNPNDIGKEPSDLDYRDIGAVNPIRHQGSCGSCWAFSAIGTIESNIYLKRGILPQLSEQELNDCDEVSYGCNGGFKGRAMGYVADNGISYRSDYPYTATDNTCIKGRPKISILPEHLEKIRYGKDTDLLNALVRIGPIAVSVYVSKNFQKYKKGVFEDDLCKDVYGTNHAVVLVGYGTENGKDYWLIRNSWGESWGEKGYIKLSRDVQNHCMVSRSGYVPIIEDPCSSSGGTSVAGQCLVFNEDSKTWDDARSSCEAKGQRLAVLQNPDIVNAYLLHNYGNERFWLGGTDRNNEGTWTWISGQQMKDFPWPSGQPDNKYNNEDCLEWGWKNNFNDQNCNDAQRYICEQGTFCPEGFFGKEGSRQCYKFYNDRLRTWEQAKEKCESEKLQLAEPQNPIPVRSHLVKDLGNERWVHIGAKGDGTAMRWLSNGQEISKNNPLWSPGQPKHLDSKHCLQLMSHSPHLEDSPNQPFFSGACGWYQYTLCE